MLQIKTQSSIYKIRHFETEKQKWRKIKQKIFWEMINHLNLENGTEFLRNILNMIRQNQQINVVLNGLTLNNSKKN